MTLANHLKNVRGVLTYNGIPMEIHLGYITNEYKSKSYSKSCSLIEGNLSLICQNLTADCSLYPRISIQCTRHLCISNCDSYVIC